MLDYNLSVAMSRAEGKISQQSRNVLPNQRHTVLLESRHPGDHGCGMVEVDFGKDLPDLLKRIAARKKDQNGEEKPL